MTHIVGIVKEFHDFQSCCTIADQLDEFTTGLTRRCASIGKSRVCLLRICERGTQGLKWMRKSARKCYLSSYLVGHPGGWVNHAIEDYVAGALDTSQNMGSGGMG